MHEVHACFTVSHKMLTKARLCCSAVYPSTSLLAPLLPGDLVLPLDSPDRNRCTASGTSAPPFSPLIAHLREFKSMTIVLSLLSRCADALQLLFTQPRACCRRACPSPTRGTCMFVAPHAHSTLCNVRFPREAWHTYRHLVSTRCDHHQKRFYMRPALRA